MAVTSEGSNISRKSLAHRDVPRDALVDFLRGVCVLSMILTHAGQGTIVGHLSISGLVGFFAGAEGFFFLSGLVFARVYRKRMLTRGTAPTTAAVAARVFKLYKYHLACIGCTLVASWLTPTQLAAFDETYTFIVERPAAAVLKAALLVYQPNFLDVLPLYIVFLPIAWLLIRARRDGSPWVAMVSLLLWVPQQFPSLAFGRMLSPGAFNLLSYQVVFFLGLWAAHGVPSTVTARVGRLSPLLILSALVAGVCFLLTHSKHLGVTVAGFHHASEVLKPQYDKFALGWLRLLNFVAVAVVLQQARPWLTWLPWQPIVSLGKRSLEVFAGHIALLILLCGPMLKLRSLPGPVVSFAVLVPVSGLVLAIAILDRRKSAFGIDQRQSRRGRRHWLRYALLLSLLSLLVSIAIGTRAGMRELAVDFTARRSHPSIPASSPLKGATTVVFESNFGDRISAWWIEGKHPESVVFVHGTDAARDQLLTEAEILYEAGFSVLLLDLPGHGESSGRPLWGRAERSAIMAALEFVNARAPDLPVGLFAFSAGAIVAAQVAATDERVGAVTLAGAPADFINHIKDVFRKWGWLSSYPAVWAAYLAGYRDDAPTTLEAASNTARVFIITGTADPIVPSAESIRVFEAARDPKQLLTVHGAAHGNYMQILGRRAYAEPLIRFYERHLLRRVTAD